MAQFSDSRTTGGGVIVNAVLNTATNTTTYTVTAPNGAVATASQNASGGINPATLSSIQQQLAQGGADAQTFSIGLRTALSSTANNTNDQAAAAPLGVQETQPIPASTAEDPQVPQPGDDTLTPQYVAPTSIELTDEQRQNLADTNARIAAREAGAVNTDTDTNLSSFGEENDPPNLESSPAPVDSEFGDLAGAQAAAADSEVPVTQEDIDAGLDEALAAQGEEEDNAPRIYSPEDLGVEEEGFFAGIGSSISQAYNRATLGSGDAINASSKQATLAKAKQQATIQARYKQPGNNDWRVRLSLGPGAQYLYNATPAGILAPLKANGGTDGVIFPYTPSITTTYSANYEQYDLIHSNYRGLFYKNSRVGDIQLRGMFTAQDTAEANYLLAVIHFFRSATKMFYGQDAERGTPPPICLLNGYGGYQFSDHPVVISSFNYTLPNDVDYIRTTNPNNFGLNLDNRYNPSGASLPAGGALAGLNRLLNALPGGLSKGALPRVPAPNSVAGSVTNNVPASYVPTKMEIDVTLIPVQSRSQVSQQFSLKGFANGDLLKGGFW